LKLLQQIGIGEPELAARATPAGFPSGYGDPVDAELGRNAFLADISRNPDGSRHGGRREPSGCSDLLNEHAHRCTSHAICFEDGTATATPTTVH
jgi:hypothetical protein